MSATINKSNNNAVLTHCFVANKKHLQRTQTKC